MTYIIPCAITKNDLFSVCMEHITTCHYVPNDIFKASRFDFMLYYVPTYVFSGKYQANWSASFGYDWTHEYTHYNTISDYDVYTKRSYERLIPERRTKTITNWVPASGVDQGDYWVQVYAGVGVDTNAVPFITNTSPPQPMKLTSNYSDGLSMDIYSISEDEAYETKAYPLLEQIISRNVKRWAKGDRQCDWFWTSQYNKSPTIKIMMPIGKCTIDYQGRDYRIWVDGKDKARVTGILPVDWNKKINAHLGLIPLVIIIVSRWFTHVSLPDFDSWLNTQLTSMGIKMKDGFIKSLFIDFTGETMFLLLMVTAVFFYFARKWFIFKRNSDVLKNLLQEYMANMKNSTNLSCKVHTYDFLDISILFIFGFICSILALPAYETKTETEYDRRTEEIRSNQEKAQIEIKVATDKLAQQQQQIHKEQSQNRVAQSLAGQAAIDLGSQYGKLIKPVNVNGHWYYFWDRSGDGSNANKKGPGYSNSVDYTQHDWLNQIFNQDINGTMGGGGNTTDNYRYATINRVHLALPTIDDLLAIYAQFKGYPPGWNEEIAFYWSATPSASGHAYVFLYYGYVYDTVDSGNSYVALEVL